MGLMREFDNRQFEAISPFTEMAAYEALWDQNGTTFKRIADLFRDSPYSSPSQLVDSALIEEYRVLLKETFSKYKLNKFGVRVNGVFEYPLKLRDAKHPIEVLYYQGDWDLIYSKSVAIVGSRKPSDEGKRRAIKLSKVLVDNGYTITSGLAEGIDTAAHQAAIAAKGRTIAVIGTPLSHFYPRQNEQLQREIARNNLVVTQVPFQKYQTQDYRINRSFFPERNKTMSAISEATIIVEASNTSGTLIQARAALAQGRKLFILDSCFNNGAITWPERFAKQGAIRVKKPEDILENL
jgi:DNA processing protein